MKRIFITLFMAFAAVAVSFAQDSKNWNSGPLTWNDFRGTPTVADGPAYLAADIVLTPQGCAAVMYPDNSYASAAERTPQRLSYFQTQFDLAELLALRLQQEIDLGISNSETDTRLAYYRQLYRTESQRLSDDTKAGANEVNLMQNASRIQAQIEELANPQASQLVASPFRYGLWVGTGFVSPTGGISKYFNTAWDFGFGALVDWRRFGLEASVTFAYPTIQDPTLTQDKYAGQGYYANVKNANYMAAGFNGGFNVVDTKKFLLRPYVGGMWTSYSWTARPLNTDSDSNENFFNGEQQRMALTDFNLTFGLNFEWHFHRAVTSFPFVGSSREEYTSSLRLTPYAIRSVYKHASDPFGGWQIGVTVAYSGVGRALSVK